MIKPSTFSIVAFEPETRSWGIAVASKFPAVGAVVPWAKAPIGAIATQSYANTTFGPIGLDLLAKGATASEAFDQLRAADPGIETRQVGIVDSHGQGFTFTGQECMDWAGGFAGPNYAVQGNILAGEQVATSMRDTFLSHTGLFWQRLLSALKAGEAAGGDKRGKQSAAILVVRENGGYAGFNDRLIDYRVDDDPDPLPRLWAMLEYNELLFGKSPDSDKLPIVGEVANNLAKVIGFPHANPNQDQSAFRAALNAYIGSENLEDRCDLSTMIIDKPAYEFLLRRTTA